MIEKELIGTGIGATPDISGMSPSKTKKELLDTIKLTVETQVDGDKCPTHIIINEMWWEALSKDLEKLGLSWAADRNFAGSDKEWSFSFWVGWLTADKERIKPAKSTADEDEVKDEVDEEPVSDLYQINVTGDELIAANNKWEFRWDIHSDGSVDIQSGSIKKLWFLPSTQDHPSALAIVWNKNKGRDRADVWYDVTPDVAYDIVDADSVGKEINLLITAENKRCAEAGKEAAYPHDFFNMQDFRVAHSEQLALFA